MTLLIGVFIDLASYVSKSLRSDLEVLTKNQLGGKWMSP